MSAARGNEAGHPFTLGDLPVMPDQLKTLMDKIWGTTRGDYAQTLRVHIGHIRKKIEPDPSQPTYILTESGIGFSYVNARGERAGFEISHQLLG